MMLMMFQPFPFSFWKPSSEAANPAYQILVKTDNAGTSLTNQFTLPATGTYDVDWGDGVVETGLTGSQTHTFPAPGNYVIKVTGGLTAITFVNGGDRLKLLEIQNWGDISWGTMASAYYGCSNMQITASDAPDTSAVLNFSNMLRSCSSVTTVPFFDTSNGTNFAFSFRSLTSLVSFPELSFASMTSGASCFSFTTLPTETWSNILIATEASNSNNNVVFDGGNSTYNVAGGVARAALVADHTWTITDAGPE